MKHLLPILTLALLGAASTASAAYYYDYYLDPPTTLSNVNYADGYFNQSDTFTYGTQDNVVGNNGSNDFSVKRELNWGTKFGWAGANNSFYYIEVSAENKEKATLYLTDFVSEVVPQAEMKFNSSSNALFNMDIAEYGYRTLTLDESGKYVAGDTTSFKVFNEDGSLSDKITEIDSVNYYDNPENSPMIRYKYELGSFNPGDIIEVYMKDVNGGEVYSFSDLENGEYVPFDNSTPVTDSQGNILTAPQGGFEDGGYRVAAIETDEMLNSYYFVEEIDGNANPNYEDYTKFDENKELAAGKAMPLSQLIPTNGTAVAFGIYAMASGIAAGDGNINGNGNGTFGSPLPGGLQFALIAGFFGLGLCYVRRRKAIVG